MFHIPDHFRLQTFPADEAVDKMKCLVKCRSDSNCAGFSVKSDQCYHLKEADKLTLTDEAGTDSYKKILEADFAKETLLQNPQNINCLLSQQNADCAFPYNYKGSNMYACSHTCSSQFTRSKILSFIWSKSGLTSLDSESNLGECKHQCHISTTCTALSWNHTTKVKGVINIQHKFFIN